MSQDELCQSGPTGTEGIPLESPSGAGWELQDWQEGHWEIPTSQGQGRRGGESCPRPLAQGAAICSIILQINFPFTSQLCVFLGLFGLVGFFCCFFLLLFFGWVFFGFWVIFCVFPNHARYYF